MTPTWKILTWPAWYGTVADFRAITRTFAHVTTAIYIGEDPDELRQGQMLWGSEVDGQMVGIAFDWADAGDNLPALTDPMNPISNVRLLDRDGACLTVGERLLELSCAIHGLKWQKAVPRRSARWMERLAA